MTAEDARRPIWIACLCAGWCRTCDAYAPVLQAAAAGLEAAQPGLVVRWIDIEDEAELVGEVDIETFPTLAVVDAEAVRFFGPLTPQPETLRRVLRTALAPDAPAQAVAPDVAAFAKRLRAAG